MFTCYSAQGIGSKFHILIKFERNRRSQFGDIYVFYNKPKFRFCSFLTISHKPNVFGERRPEDVFGFFETTLEQNLRLFWENNSFVFLIEMKVLIYSQTMLSYEIWLKYVEVFGLWSTAQTSGWLHYTFWIQEISKEICPQQNRHRYLTYDITLSTRIFVHLRLW